MGIEISKVSKNGSALNVEWSDGEKSNFHFMWLRDNCPTAHDKDSRHRMFNILSVSTKIEPKTCKINKEGKIEETFASFTKPLSKKIIKKLEEIL